MHLKMNFNVIDYVQRLVKRFVVHKTIYISNDSGPSFEDSSDLSFFYVCFIFIRTCEC